MKRFCSFLLVLIFALSVFSGCGGSAAPETESALPESTASPTSPIPDDAYYDGYTFTVLVAGGGSENDFSHENGKTPALSEALYRRNRAAEETLGILIKTKESFGYLSPATRGTGYDALVKSYYAKTCDYDLAAVGAYDAAVLACCGLLSDLKTLPGLDLSREWWDASAEKDLSLWENVFFTSGDLLLSQAERTACVLSFDGLLTDGEISDLYASVLSGRFTWDSLAKTAREVLSRTDPAASCRAVITSSGSLLAALHGAGVRIARTDGEGLFTLSLDASAGRAFSACASVLLDPGLCYTPQRETDAVGAWEAERDNAFAAGNALFCLTTLAAVPGLRERGVSFSVLPYPTAQEGRLCESSVDPRTAQMICAPYLLENAKRTGVVTEALAYLTNREVRPLLIELYRGAGKGSAETQDEILALLFGRHSYDFGEFFGFGDYAYATAALTDPEGWDAMIGAGRETAEEQIAPINAKLAELYRGVR
ncbi:MAG: hypothetical protein IJR89_05150 [Clostridia bacterium]|nr:hypothetical protein [Clostridia bacterium]